LTSIPSIVGYGFIERDGGVLMGDRLIILPDENFIAVLAAEFKKEEPEPDLLCVDGHVDLPYFMARHAKGKKFESLERGPVTPDTVKGSGVRLFATAIYCQDKYNDKMSMLHFQKNYDYTMKVVENITRVKGMNDISQIKANREMIGTILLLENADVLANNIGLALSLRDRGIYIVGLTHAGKNRLADGDSIIHSDGITPAGREVIHILNDNNILIDVAHLHPACFYQLMDLVERPCVSSHTGIRERCNLQRNLDLEQVRHICERGGLIGITFNPEMLTPTGEAGIDDIFIHLDTVVQRFGPEYAALGSDFCGFDQPAKGMKDYTGIKGLKAIMKAHGYTKEAIYKILGLNWLRIYEGIL
jgi:membrane dipeptidase